MKRCVISSAPEKRRRRTSFARAIGWANSCCGTAVQTAPARMRAVIDAVQALRGIAVVTAVTIAAEVGELSRFAKPRQLMGYSGAVASEHSSGERTRRGGISKTRQAHP